MNDLLLVGTIAMVAGAASLGYALMWTFAWFNQLTLFMMKIYKDEPSTMLPQYAIMPPILFALALLLWKFGDSLVTFALFQIQ